MAFFVSFYPADGDDELKIQQNSNHQMDLSNNSCCIKLMETLDERLKIG